MPAASIPIPIRRTPRRLFFRNGAGSRAQTVSSTVRTAESRQAAKGPTRGRMGFQTGAPPGVHGHKSRASSACRWQSGLHAGGVVCPQPPVAIDPRWYSPREKPPTHDLQGASGLTWRRAQPSCRPKRGSPPRTTHILTGFQGRATTGRSWGSMRPRARTESWGLSRGSALAPIHAEHVTVQCG